MATRKFKIDVQHNSVTGMFEFWAWVRDEKSAWTIAAEGSRMSHDEALSAAAYRAELYLQDGVK